jgi:hypothetical protein
MDTVQDPEDEDPQAADGDVAATPTLRVFREVTRAAASPAAREIAKAARTLASPEAQQAEALLGEAVRAFQAADLMPKTPTAQEQEKNGERRSSPAEPERAPETVAEASPPIQVRKPRVPTRRKNRERWRACWKLIRPRATQPAADISGWMTNHHPEYPHSPETLERIILAGLDGLLD